eukprot:IDg14676t1
MHKEDYDVVAQTQSPRTKLSMKWRKPCCASKYYQASR